MGGVEGMEGAYELEGAMESAHVHICQRQMCLPAPEGAHEHIYRRQMCLI